MSYHDVKEMCYLILDSGITQELEMSRAERMSFNKSFYRILKNPKKKLRETEAFLRKFIEDFNIERKENYNISGKAKRRIQKGNQGKYEHLRI